MGSKITMEEKWDVDSETNLLNIKPPVKDKDDDKKKPKK